MKDLNRITFMSKYLTIGARLNKKNKESLDLTRKVFIFKSLTWKNVLSQIHHYNFDRLLPSFNISDEIYDFHWMVLKLLKN